MLDVPSVMLASLMTSPLEANGPLNEFVDPPAALATVPVRNA